MTADAQILALNIAIPTQPRAIAEMSRLLASPTLQIHQIGAVIGSDMGLASAVLKAVNTALFGLSGQVQSVLQALTHLGTREVAAITLQMGLRAAFPASPALDVLWARAAVRARRMACLATALQRDPWVAHSAGLFEECGKAIFVRHAPDRYRAMLAAADSDTALLFLEHEAFGVGHDALGAAMCETWGLAPAAVHSVRHHVMVQSALQLPPQVADRSICALSVLAGMVGNDQAGWEDRAASVGDQLAWPRPSVLAAVEAARAADRADPNASAA